MILFSFSFYSVHIMNRSLFDRSSFDSVVFFWSIKSRSSERYNILVPLGWTSAFKLQASSYHTSHRTQQGHGCFTCAKRRRDARAARTCCA